MAVGAQRKFSWAGVAAAGVASGVAFGVGRELGIIDKTGNIADGRSLTDNRGFANIAAHTVRYGASAIADAATRSAIEGSSFSDGLRAAIPNVIGQVIGDLAIGNIQNPDTWAERNRKNPAASSLPGPMLHGPESGHTIKEGDTYWSLAKADLPGASPAEIAERVTQYIDLNPDVDPLSLQIGQSIKSPGAGAESASTIDLGLMKPGQRRHLTDNEITTLTGIDAEGNIVGSGSSYTLLNRSSLQKIWIFAGGGNALFPNYQVLNPKRLAAHNFAESTNNAVTYADNEMVFPSASAKMDFSSDVEMMALLAHEVMHIWQYKQYSGARVWPEATLRDYKYAINSRPDHILDDYGIEEQAAMMQDLYRRDNGLDAIWAYTGEGVPMPKVNASTLRAELFMSHEYVGRIMMERAMARYEQGGD